MMAAFGDTHVKGNCLRLRELFPNVTVALFPWPILFLRNPQGSASGDHESELLLALLRRPDVGLGSHLEARCRASRGRVTRRPRRHRQEHGKARDGPLYKRAEGQRARLAGRRAQLYSVERGASGQADTGSRGVPGRRRSPGKERRGVAARETLS